MMEKAGSDMSGSTANNSSDFVRKLYKMLEEPAHDDIVRWGDGGLSFVVLENEKFTKQILPKHFKHSNFASFVRQLNKYDFHKVRQSNEDNTQSPYGNNAWEFKHPDFQMNKKDSLDNIRRKAPAPRKPATNMEEQYPTSQQIDMLNAQLMATQQQFQGLSDRYDALAQGHMAMIQQVVQLQKIVKNHDSVTHKIMQFLHSADAQQRRHSRIAGPFGSGTEMSNVDNAGNEGAIDDHPASPLQQASELLEQFSAENLPSRELEQMSHQAFQAANDFATPPNEHRGQPMAPHSDNNHPHFGHPMANDLESMVYPVGHTNGIDPMNSEHIPNIPYSLPPNGMHPVEAMPEMLPGNSAMTESERKANGAVESVWGMTKPRILLVEDDKICARIGSKFLQLFECGVEIARDGLEAVNKINNGPTQFDLILMDIIMPHLDGVSATVCIREIKPQIPIIAMTSNIRADDIDMYFRYGMNDVLPKPFTKDGMLRALEKNLPQFKKDAAPFSGPGQQMVHPPGGFVTPNATQAPLGLSMAQLQAGHSLKVDTSPGKSPATSTWQSPSQIPGPSPVTAAPGAYMQQPMGDNRQFAMTPTHPHPQSGFSASQNPNMGAPRPAPQQHRRVMSDMSGGAEEHPEKRQRMYPPGGGFPQ